MKRYEDCNLWMENGKIVSFEGNEVVYAVSTTDYKQRKSMKLFDRWGNYCFVNGKIAEEYFDTADKYISSPSSFYQYERTDKRMLGVYGRRLARYSQTISDMSMADAAKLFAVAKGGAFRFTKDVIKSAESYLVNRLNRHETTDKEENSSEIELIPTKRGYVRTISIDGKRWYSSVDIGKLVERANPYNMKALIGKAEVRNITIETKVGRRPTNMIDRECAMSIIIRARKPYLPTEKAQLLHELFDNETV